MDSNNKIPYSALENPKYRTLYGRCHVTTATKTLPLLLIGYYIASFAYFSYKYGPEPDGMALILLFSVIYFTPFIAIKKVQPMWLIPLLIVLVYTVVLFTHEVIGYLLSRTGLARSKPGSFIFNTAFTFYNAIFLYFTFRCYQYLKEMKMLQQKQQQIITEVNA